MRPPPYPLVHGRPVQPRPKFMLQCQIYPPKKLGIFNTKENRHSMMRQCCQRGHEKNPYPLQSVHMHNPVRAGFDPQAPRPKLPRNPYKVAPLLVHQFE